MQRKDLFRIRGRTRAKEALKPHTTFRIGGPARFFIEPRDRSDLCQLLDQLKVKKVPFLLIGAGSNILASDNGITKAVLRLSSPEFRKISSEGVNLKAGAGSLLGQIVKFAQDRNLSGAEFLAGIPGTLGGALVMNAGAWGKQIADLVAKIAVMDYNGRIKILQRKEIRFGYRSSGLSRYIILEAVLKLNRGNSRMISKLTQEYLDSRRQSQDLSGFSAGCVFKNPAGDFSGRLIDACGLKGLRAGDAMISTKHANFILNCGNASFRDVQKLMAQAKRQVKKKFRITLEPEIKIWE